MADLDRDLPTRLSRLAAAVPVSTGELDAVRHGAITPRQRIRLAWVTPLVVVVAGILITGALGNGPFAPGASPVPSDPGPVRAATRSGDFELTLTSSKAVYGRDEPIDISATLTFLGKAPIEIAHSQGAIAPGRGNGVGPGQDAPAPVGFGMAEPVIGDLQLAPNWRESCSRSTLAPANPMFVPFAKAAAWSGDDPRADEYRAFVLDPVLRLEPGTWHPYAVAEFSIGDCGGEPVKMRVDLEIEVGAEGQRSAPPAEPTGSPAPPDPTAGPAFRPEVRGTLRNTDRDALFELTMEAAERVFRTDEPIDVTTAYSYLGPDPDMIVGHFEPEISFAIDELDEDGNIVGKSFFMKLYDSACSGRRLERGVPAEIPIAAHNLMSVRGRALPGGFYTDLDQGILRLAPGRWQVKAFLTTYVGGCLEPGEPLGEQHDLGTWVEIEVVPSTWARIELRTTEAPANACHQALGGGVLTTDPDSGIGVDRGEGTTQPVLWPFGYSGWRTAEGIVLMNEYGRVVARQGDLVSFGGGLTPDGAFHACTGIDGDRQANR